MQSPTNMANVFVLLAEAAPRAVRRRHCVGGGAPVNFRPKKSAAARRGVGGQKHFLLRFTKKFRSILKIF